MIDDEPEDFRPGGHTVFCEDIRNEVEGRHTYVGVFHAAVGVAEFPAVIPKFSAAINYRQPRDFNSTEVTVKIIYDIEGEVPIELFGASFDVKAVLNAQGGDPGKWLLATAQVVMSPLQLKAPGTMKVRAYVNGLPAVRLGSVRLTKISDLRSPVPLAQETFQTQMPST